MSSHGPVERTPGDGHLAVPGSRDYPKDAYVFVSERAEAAAPVTVILVELLQTRMHHPYRSVQYEIESNRGKESAINLKVSR